MASLLCRRTSDKKKNHSRIFVDHFLPTGKLQFPIDTVGIVCYVISSDTVSVLFSTYMTLYHFASKKHSGKVRTYYAVWICLFYAKPYGVLVHSFSEYKERRIIQTCLIRFLFTNVLALTFIVC